MSEPCRISVIGLGYVGCVGMATLAKLGHKVWGVDASATRVALLTRGQPTIHEPGLAALLAEAHAAGHIAATNKVAAAVAATDISMICVGTPLGDSDQLDLSALWGLGQELGEALRTTTRRHVIAVRSTVPPGTTAALTDLITRISGRVAELDFAVVAHPEFLREGTAVADFFAPPFTVLGSHTAWATDALREVYRDVSAPLRVVSPQSAELLKLTCNAFHALKVTFANEIATLSSDLGADGKEIMELFCQDRKLNLSPAYLRPGFAYGGSCLPKDVRVLSQMARAQGHPSPVLQAIESSNASHEVTVCQDVLACDFRHIGVVGLAFKSGTDDLRGSPVLRLVERLLNAKRSVRVFDPLVSREAAALSPDAAVRAVTARLDQAWVRELAELEQTCDLIILAHIDASTRAAIHSWTRIPAIYDLLSRELTPAPAYAGAD